MIFHDSVIFFTSSKHQSEAHFKNLNDSEVLSSDFPSLKTSATSDLSGLNSFNDLDSLVSLKDLLILMLWSSLAPKWLIPVPFCGMDHQKSNFLLIFDTLSVGGCWGQPMLLFWKLIDETQISKPPEPTMHHNSIKLWILLSLSADLLYILQYETPCMTITGLFQCDSWCLPTQNWLKTPPDDISMQEFYKGHAKL